MPVPSKSHGAKFYIGGTTLADTAETTWTQIGGCYASGAGLGVTWATTDGTTFDDPYKQNLKTVADLGDFELSMRRYIGDAGQAALKAAAGDKTNVAYNFKIELDDDAPSAGNNPTSWTFKVRVLSFEAGPGGINALVDAKSKMHICSAITETAAAA